MLVPQFGQVHPPPRNSLRLTGFLRCSCSRPHPGQVTFRSNPLPATTSQTEFRLRPHFPDLPAVSVAIISKTTQSTTATITLKRNTIDRKSTRLNSSHLVISYAVFCLKKK